MWLNGVTAFDEGLGAVGAGSGRVKFGTGGADGPDLSPGCIVVLILRFNCWKEPITPLEGRGFGSGADTTGPAPDFSGSGMLVVVVFGIDGGGGGGGFDMSCAFSAFVFASSAAASRSAFCCLRIRSTIKICLTICFA